MTDFGMFVGSNSDPARLVKIIKCSAALKGDETEDELAASLAAHLALRENGLLMSNIEFDRQNKPAFIVSYWKQSKFETEELPKGQRFAYIPKPTYDRLAETTKES
jgi:hypothetical protein